VRLERLEEGGILPHEATLSGPKEDRLLLTRATRAHLSPVFSLFSDPHGEFDRLCAEHTACSPVDTVRDSTGARHRFWVVTDPAFAAAMATFLADRTLVIADGHHRYETALRYRDEMRALHNGKPGPWDWVLMAVAPLESPGITVLPTHRVLRGVDPAKLEGMQEAARQWFAVEEAAGLADLLARMETERSAGRHAFGMYAPASGYHLLRLDEPDGVDALLEPGHSKAWRRLDVAILHGVVIGHLLGIATERGMQSGDIGFVKAPSECVRLVDGGDYQLALFLNPTPATAIRDVALAGEKMPQKSTYFFPKVLDGLVMYSMEP
ncbi:MAG: DUF1015 domain-containing protein, partial [Armatimonadota bacterium]|nr:DUF1015 domain-containing protein [Armatimonadota bacterium]